MGDMFYGKILVETETTETGETVTITGASGSIYTGTIDADGHYAMILPAFEKYTITIKGISESVDLGCGDMKSVYIPLNKTTFAGVQNILNMHRETEFLEIGDTIRTTLSSQEEVDFQIAAIDHPNEVQHSVIWIAKNTLLTAMTHNNVSDINYTWNTSRIRTYLNGTFYNDLLQSDIKPYVKERTTYAATHGGTSSCTAYRDMVFLPRTYEAIGSNGNAPACEHDSGGATQFPIFTAAANSRIKYRGIDGLTGVKWTLLSPSTGKYSSTTARPYSCEILESGATNGYGNNYAGSEYVVPCWLQVADE